MFIMTTMIPLTTPDDLFADFTVTGDTTLLGDLFVIDGQNKKIIGMDMDKAMAGGNSANAIVSRLDLLDNNGNTIDAKPLGLAVGDRKVYVSFDDTSVWVYNYPQMYNSQSDINPIFAPKKFQLPIVATRMDIFHARSINLEGEFSINTNAIDGYYLSYISEEFDYIGDNRTITEQIHLLDPDTLESMGTVPVMDPKKPDYVTWEEGEELRNGYVLGGISAIPLPKQTTEPNADWGDYSFFEGDDKMGYAVLSLHPDSLTVVDPTGNPEMNFSFPVPRKSETIMETPLTLSSQRSTDPEDYALATRLVLGRGYQGGSLGSLNHIIRNGRQIEMKQGERIFKSTWYPRSDLSLYDYSTYPERRDFFWWGNSLEWKDNSENMEVKEDRVSFEIISFRDGFNENTTVFYPEIGYVDAHFDKESPFGNNPKFPYSYYTVGNVDPFALTTPEAISLAANNKKTGVFDSRIWLDDAETLEPAPIGVLMEFEPSGSYKLVPDDNPKAEDYSEKVVNVMEIANTKIAEGGLSGRSDFEMMNWIGRVYLGIDKDTGARYAGNYILDTVPGPSTFTLPTEIEDPQDISVVSRGTADITGKVTTTDKNNRNVPLQNVQLKISLNNGTTTYYTYTNEEGEYTFTPRGYATKDFQIEVILKDREGYFTLRSEKGYNDNIVTLKTKRFAFTKDTTSTGGFQKYKDAVLNIQFSPTWAHLDPTMTANQKSVLRDSAVYYYNTYVSMKYATETLQIILNHKLPVNLFIHSSNAGVYYSTDTSFINVQAAGGKSAAAIWESPNNREYHEFGHHVHADATMGGSNTFPDYQGGDTNHGGVNNKDSTDSVVEGFAEFFSILVAKDSKYKWGTASLNDLEVNYHTTKVKTGVIGPDEEFNVATLLWDLVDDDTEAGDLMKLGISVVWEILNSKDITTINSIYKAFNDSYGWQDTDKTDVHSDLDLLFVTHRFYSDTNKNGRWDAGEKIGYADFYEPKSATGKDPRKDRFHVNGTSIAYTIEESPGVPISTGQFNISVTFNDTMYDYSYLTDPIPGSGEIDLHVPMDSLGLDIVPQVPGFTGTPIHIDPQPWWDHVATAEGDESDIFLTETFQLSENSIPAPTSLISDNDPTFLQLNWDKAPGYDTVLFVRGMTRPPTSPTDGVALLLGTDSVYVDSDLLPGLDHHYTVFTKDGEEYSQGVSITVSIPVDLQEPTDDPGPGDDDDDDDPDPDPDGNDDDDPNPDPDNNGTGEEDDDDDDDGFPVALVGGLVLVIVILLVGVLVYLNIVTIPGFNDDKESEEKKDPAPSGDEKESAPPLPPASGDPERDPKKEKTKDKDTETKKEKENKEEEDKETETKKEKESREEEEKETKTAEGDDPK